MCRQPETSARHQRMQFNVHLKLFASSPFQHVYVNSHARKVPLTFIHCYIAILSGFFVKVIEGRCIFINPIDYNR